MRKRLVLAILSLSCLSLSAQQTYTMTPSRGPVAGGTVVTITGAFVEFWSYGVIFGSTGVPATRVNATTLVATTPAHLPATVPVTIFEYDRGISTDIRFTFEGEATDAFDRLLLPFFTYPIPGAFGSEFRSDLSISLARGERVDIFGLNPPCRVTCITSWYTPFTITTEIPDLDTRSFETSGTPGLFVYIPKTQEKHAAMNLRAHDTSREAENFGTELPVVRDEEFTNSCTDSILFPGVPSDPLFRKTLRIYGEGPGTTDVVVAIETQGVTTTHSVTMRPGSHPFEPHYAEFSAFPASSGPLRVRLRYPVCPSLAPQASFWGFISVTNNDTQLITTITPQP
jgi:hypothetical protein